MQEYFMNLSKKQKIIIIIVIVVLLLVIFLFAYGYFYSSEEEETFADESNIVNQVIEEEADTSLVLGSTKNKVIVHVIGEVVNPGVVTLKEGERIIDAITAAGGKTEDADLSKINLAYIVDDGTQIYVPRIGQQRQELITEGAGDGVIVETATLAPEEEKDTKVNINTATQEKLMTLPGIGEATAQKIIDYRTQNGKFQTPEDLKNVPRNRRS